MARTTAVRRVPARGRPAELLAAPSQQLSPRSSRWGREATGWVAVGIAGFGAAPLLDHPGLAGPALASGALTGLTRGVLGRRNLVRSQLADRLVEALSPALGLRGCPDRRVVRLKWWRRGWPGVPRRVELRYAPGVDDTDPAWLPAVLLVVSRRLLADYQVAEHDRRRCRIGLRWISQQQAEPIKPAAQLRAERTIGELLGPTAAVTGVQWAGGELAALDVRHEAATKLSASGYRSRVERVVSTMLPGRWRARWDMEGDTVRFELRPAFPASVWQPVDPVDADLDLLDGYLDLQISYGVDEDGAVMRWRPPQDPHVMVTGTTGSGKTVTAHTLLVQLARRGAAVWVVDGKGVEFLGFQDWPNVQIVATSIAEQVAVIHRAWELMEHRYELVTSGRAHESDFEPLFVVLDEYADFRGNLLDWYAEVKVKGDPARPPVLAKVGSLGRKARTARIHLLFGTQRPDQEFLGGAGTADLRDNLRLRISMGRLSPQGAMMMWNSPAIGTSIPVGCRGRATTINDANQAVEIQTYRTPDPRKVVAGGEDDRLLDQLRPAAVRHDRLLILPPQAQADLDTDEVKAPTYAAYASAPWVLASQRPDLDPVLHRQRASVHGRDLASPMAVFGLTPLVQVADAAGEADLTGMVGEPERSGARPSGASHDLVHLLAVPAVDSNADLDESEQGGDQFGYGLAEARAVDELQIGDLVLVDEDTGVWGVVDEQIEADLADPGYLAVSWRGDDDDCGLLSLPDDTTVTVRRPLELVGES